MSFRALLVTKDDQAVEALTPVLSNFGLAVQTCAYPDALCRVTEQRFHALLVDFDDPHSASLVFENLANARFQNRAITVALLADRGKVRQAFGAGASFVIYKPINRQQAENSLRAAVSLIRNERRTSLRVPIQVPIELLCNGEEESTEGILLDLSEEGMDLLASQPLYCSAVLNAHFRLPGLDSDLEVPGEVVWANPNGESGIRFAGIPERTRVALRKWLKEFAKPAPAPEPTPRPDCKLTDLSLGGCYIETPSPFPERTTVLLKMRAGVSELQIAGVIRVMHPTLGMGIEFTGSRKARQAGIERFIEALGESGAEPELLVSPGTLSYEQMPVAANTDVDDPLLDLLLHHESFSQEKFLQALQRQRNGQVAEAN
jgi:CheY-like chemotaxis protein